MLLLLNEHGDPSFFFQNLISHMYNINNKQAKFDNNLSVALVLFQWNDLKLQYTTINLYRVTQT